MKIGEVKDIDLGWDSLMKSLSVGGVDVGIKIEDTPREDADISNLELAMIHEFGLGNSPQRSFIRSTFDENREKYVKMFALLVAVFFEKRKTWKQNPVKGSARRVAMEYLRDIKAKIKAGIPPPNTPEVIQRKGSSTPLIDTNQLINSLKTEES